MIRTAAVDRKTGETDISVDLLLDGSGEHDIATGIGFFDHMLTLLAVHGFFDLTLRAKGDLEVDNHHTVEDVGLALGDAFDRALGDRKGIRRYGHAVLRATDPRFKAFHQFGRDRFPDDPVFKTVDVGFQVIPEVLKEHGKAANPYPNVDAGSGALLYHYGITEMLYYTVLFGVSRAMGMTSQLIMSRAMMEPITRPKSVNTKWLKKEVGMA